MSSDRLIRREKLEALRPTLAHLSSLITTRQVYELCIFGLHSLLGLLYHA